MTSSSKIYLGFAVFLAVLGSAFILPKLAVGNQTGFAASTTAAGVFLGGTGLAFTLALVLLVVTLRSRASLPAGARIAGLLPLPILAAGAIVLAVMIWQKQQEQRRNDPPPRALTPTSDPAHTVPAP